MEKNEKFKRIFKSHSTTGLMEELEKIQDMHKSSINSSTRERKLTFSTPMLSSEEGEKKSRCLLKQNDKWKQKWDIIIIICAIYNCFSISLQISFRPAMMEESAFIYINTLTDIAFFLDIIINFRVSFINDTGDEINEPRAIAINYLKGMFWIDLAATLPIDEILSLIFDSKNDLFMLFALLKMGRLLKL